MSKANNDETIRLLKEVVEASNRTNHAVRAIVRPIYVQLVTVLILLPLFLLYSASPNVELLILITLIFVGGGVAAIAALISEFSRSKIPYDFGEELRKGYETVSDERSRTLDTSAGARADDSVLPSAPKTFLLPGECECSTWQRGFGGTTMENGKKVCMRCRKIMPNQ